ncbi:MAG: methionine ABC transporter ATP-binding protein [Desulfitobacteriaceae bacterium]|jgi:D-methionine transport system ATP-binding protein|nr:methionine ABC transporter ATP-binding protein [Desulfitobacteriaceae bacterium]
MIKISNLYKAYGDLLVLDNVNLEIKKGDIYGLVGVSGAGKSTLLRCINGLESYDQGTLTVDGVDIKTLNRYELRKFRSNIGMIFQQFSLLERKTVYENIALPLQCWKYKKADIDKKVRELLELVELKDKVNIKPRELSGGQKQRVAIARALTLNPKILLCDEATSALDPNITKSILQLLRKINKELQITIIIVTHQMPVVKQVCSNMSILSKGKVEVSGRVEDIFLDKPKILYEVLGKEQEYLPDNGINIEILRREKSSNNSILSEMAIATQTVFSIVLGSLDHYQDDIKGSIVINVQTEDREKIINYLNMHNIEWRKF